MVYCRVSWQEVEEQKYDLRRLLKKDSARVWEL